MADDPKISLVDLILEATKQAAQAPAPPAPAPKAAPRPPKEPEIETAPRRWAMDPDVTSDICGLVEGSRFEMTDCGEELDGVWRVVRLNLAHPSPLERHLYAERESGGPPYVKMSEDAVREELHDGRLRVIG